MHTYTHAHTQLLLRIYESLLRNSGFTCAPPQGVEIWAPSAHSMTSLELRLSRTKLSEVMMEKGWSLANNAFVLRR